MIATLRQIIAAPWAINPEYAVYAGIYLRDFLEHNKEYKARSGYSEEESKTSFHKQTAIVSIRGELLKYDTESGRPGMLTIADTLKSLDQTEEVENIVLVIDSPGGTVAGTEELANTIKQIEKPVYALIDGTAASAAYWIASAADKVYAHSKYDTVGSIGVMFDMVDIQPYYEKMGVKFHRVYADQSEEKNDIFEEVLKGNYELLKKEKLNPLAENFRNTIKQNRPTVEESQLKGKTYFAKDVIGTLIDGIKTLDELLNELNNNTQKSITMEEKQGKSFWSKIGETLGLKAADNMEPEDIALTMREQLSALQKEKELLSLQLAEQKQKLEQALKEKEELTAKLQEKETELEEVKALGGAEKNTVKKETDAITKPKSGLEPVTSEDMSLKEKIQKVKEAYL